MKSLWLGSMLTLLNLGALSCGSDEKKEPPGSSEPSGASQSANPCDQFENLDTDHAEPNIEHATLLEESGDGCTSGEALVQSFSPDGDEDIEEADAGDNDEEDSGCTEQKRNDDGTCKWTVNCEDNEVTFVADLWVQSDLRFAGSLTMTRVAIDSGPSVELTCYYTISGKISIQP